MTAKINFINENGVVDCIEGLYRIHGLFGKYRPLSNFHLENVTVDGYTYKCSEAAYMAEKTENLDEQYNLMSMTGLEAKRYGQTVTLVSNWEDIKVERMHKVLFAKFSQCKYLADLLLSTGNKHIEETNWWKDHFWGVCNGYGQNHMGKLLMQIREVLRWENIH